MEWPVGLKECEMFFSIKELQKQSGLTTCIDGEWVQSRPANHKYRTLFERIEEAWYVFTGKADAVVWPKNQ